MIDPARNDGKLRFIWVTDSHTTTNDTLFRNLALMAAVDDCNTWLPDFFVHTGDAGNDLPSTVVHFFSIVNDFERPVYVAIGNHDEKEEPPGNLLTSEIEGANAFNRVAPFYYSVDYLNALLVFLDCNFFGDTPDEIHQIGDRVGRYTGEPPGGDLRQLGTTQLEWLTDTINDSLADYILIFLHYPLVGLKASERISFPAILAGDGRPVRVFYGHNHNWATTKMYSGVPFYKCPALQESGCWTRVIISETGMVENMIICNFTDPGSWRIESPFELRRVSSPLALAVQ